MQDINNILFPTELGDKHPNTVEIIKIAEERNITVSQIANLMGCSQPYISQLKSGKGNAKVKDIQPLIHLLSATVPGAEFHTYKIIKKMSPKFPDDWEEAVLVAGVNSVSEKTSHGRYPTGDDGYDVIEKNHYEVVERVKDNRNTYLNNVVNLQIPTMKARLEEGLDTYLVEKNEKQKRIETSNDDLQKWVIDAINRLDYKYRGDEKFSIEEKLTEIIEPSYMSNHEFLNREDSWDKNALLQLCNQASDILSIPFLVSNNPHARALEETDVRNVMAPEKHAQRLIEKLDSINGTIEEENRKKREKFKLKKLFKKSVWESIDKYSVTCPKLESNWGDFAQDLFGGAICEVFKSSREPAYEVNLTDSFNLWVNDIKFDIDEEEVQVCGPILISTKINDSQITIHELYSKKFIILHKFYSHKAKKDVSVLSEPLDTSSLLDEIQNESEIFQWEEEVDSLIMDVKTSLSSLGYRVPGIRSVY